MKWWSMVVQRCGEEVGIYEGAGEIEWASEADAGVFQAD